MIVIPSKAYWSGNQQAILHYVPHGKNLKLIWEGNQETIARMLQPLRDVATDESISFSFAGRPRTFQVLNVASDKIREFQERVRALPDSLP
jgi:hypothetical protein